MPEGKDGRRYSEGVTYSDRTDVILDNWEYVQCKFENCTFVYFGGKPPIFESCELKLWIRGRSEPLQKQFRKGTGIESVSRMLAAHCH